MCLKVNKVKVFKKKAKVQDKSQKVKYIVTNGKELSF